MFLRQAVEGEGGDGAFQMRGVDAQVQWEQHQPGSIPFDPDQNVYSYSFYLFLACLGFELGRGGAEHITASSAK